ncbi:serine/threonine-protein phosphatase [Anaeramoeba flamelloides]|uniref:Serine/threonine-protein phosphatase n=1 Tax=Anaeramoeba flamelloides TaxID=1746091 RepID=A0AAV7ZI48_9EUKA|nr:serine/threonine-protein phosphatase [Anaeramoeba flamelloides]
MEKSLTEKKKQSLDLKNLGNKEVGKKNFEAAIDYYTEGISIFPTAILYSNRSLCHIKLEHYAQALKDADHSIVLNPDYCKAYYRKGDSLFGLGKFEEAKEQFKKVVFKRPKDLDSRKKFIQCKKEIEKIQSNLRLASLVSHQSNSPDWTKHQIDQSYDGPRMENETITKEFCEELLNHFKNYKKLPMRYTLKILHDIQILFQTLKTVTDVTVKEGQNMTVVGDIHGQFFDLVELFKVNGLPSETNMYLFNGDIVDRGDFSLECVLLIYSLKLLYPEHVHINRGNHESAQMNYMYGFYREAEEKIFKEIIPVFERIFNHLPLVTIINEKIFVCHGGLFPRDDVTIDEIRKIDRVRQPPQDTFTTPSLFTCLLWSDPGRINGRSTSPRGTALIFGPDVTKKFLKLNNLDLIIRSHEMKLAGYEIMHERKLITVFSAPNYYGTSGNRGAIVRFDSKLKKKIIQFDAIGVKQSGKYGFSMF